MRRFRPDNISLDRTALAVSCARDAILGELVHARDRLEPWRRLTQADLLEGVRRQAKRHSLENGPES